MTAVFLILSGVFPLLCIGLGIPLMLKRVPPNWWYGVRTAATVSNPDLWYVVNHRAGTGMIATGVTGLIAAGTVWSLTTLPDTLKPIASIAVTAVLLGLTAIDARRTARRHV